MAQAAVTSVPHKQPSKAKAKRDVFCPSGRGGSGNIRPSKIAIRGERSPDLFALPPRERQSTSTVDKKQFMSSGRGGSGNIQPQTSDLEAHPLTASILSQHSATQAQYEKRVREAHAESNVVRSSGRGGSGNISDPRRRSRSQEPKTLSKRHFFTRKGRQRCNSLATQAHDGEDGTSMRSDRDKRTTTCSSCSSSAWAARQSEESRISSAMTSSSEATTNSLSSGDAVTGQKRLRGFVIRRSMKPPSLAPTYPRSWHTGSSGSSLRAHSPASIILEDREYVSFLEL